MKLSDDLNKQAGAADEAQDLPEQALAQLEGGELDAVVGGKANGEWEYRTATAEDLGRFGSGGYCPYCVGNLFKVMDPSTGIAYYVCNRCRIQWTYQTCNGPH